MLTIRNTNVESINRDTVNIGGHEVRCTYDANGAHIDHAELRRLREAGHANWSDTEIADLAYHAETRMDETYTRAYDIGVYEGFNQDQWVVLDSIRVADDAAANAYAEQHHHGREWYVLDSTGKNING
jgi:hypothetical protein